MPILAPPPMELPPYVYIEARKAAASVVVIDVATITGLNGATSGVCTLNGTVTAVEHGEAFAPGQTITVAVPCIGPTWEPRAGPWPGYRDSEFMRTTQGRAWLDAQGGLVRRGFDILNWRTSGD